jgi:hypothetical protein
VAWLTYTYWPAAVVLMAWAQGWLMPAIRRTPPGAEARLQAFALHWLLTACYFLPLSLAPSLLGIGVALSCRLLLFDPVLNLAAGDIVFAVGSTAKTDRAIRWASNKLGMEPEHLRCILWVICLALAITTLLIFRLPNI